MRSTSHLVENASAERAYASSKWVTAQGGESDVRSRDLGVRLAQDALYSSSGGLVVTGQKSSARYVGSHAAAQLQWKIKPAQRIYGVLALLSGRIPEAVNGGRNINYLTGRLEFKF